MYQEKVTVFFMEALKDTDMDFHMDKTMEARLKDIHMPQKTVDAVLDQAYKALSYISKKHPHLSYQADCGLFDIKRVKTRQVERGESVFDAISSVSDNFGVFGIPEVSHRQMLKRIANFVIENDNEWIKTYGDEKDKQTEHDSVNHPSHYAGQGEIECIDYISAMVAPYTGVVAGDLQNLIKYTWRSGHKSDASLSDDAKALEDLEKAKWYANHAIKTIGVMQKDKDRWQWMTNALNTYKQGWDEEMVITKGMAQVMKGMSPAMESAYQTIVGTIANGNLYRNSNAPKFLVDALDKMIENSRRKKTRGSLRPKPKQKDPNEKDENLYGK